MSILGLINKNPLNVKQGKTPWKGSIATDDLGHAIFDDPLYSVRACVRTLEQKFRNGKTTLEKIMASYAPIDDGNRPAEYADFVSSRIDLAVDDNLDLFDNDGRIRHIARLVGILIAMAEMECGHGYRLPTQTINAGIVMYEQDFVNKV